MTSAEKRNLNTFETVSTHVWQCDQSDRPRKIGNPGKSTKGTFFCRMLATVTILRRKIYQKTQLIHSLNFYRVSFEIIFRDYLASVCLSRSRSGARLVEKKLINNRKSLDGLEFHNYRS